MKFLVQNTDKMQNIIDKFFKDNNINIKTTVSLTDKCDRAQSYSKLDPLTKKNHFFIEFNDTNWINMSWGNNAEVILNTLIHECLHILAFCKHLKCNDGDYDFEKLLFDYGADSNYDNFELEEMHEEFLDINLDDREKHFTLIKNKYLNLLL